MIQEVGEKIFCYDSKVPGKIVTIMVGVHGNERSGIEAVDELFLGKNFKIDSGKVYFIYGNIRAIEFNKRFCEKNMNRCFFSEISGNSYEEKRVIVIKKYLDTSDFLLDIHNTLNKKNKDPFLISESREIGKYFPVKYIISGLDILHPGGSDGYMNSIGKVGICLESGSIYNENGKDIAKNSIINFLKYTGNIATIPRIFREQEYIEYDFIFKGNPYEFKFSKHFKNFEYIRKGQAIGRYYEKEIIAKEDVNINFIYVPGKGGYEIFCLGKYL